MSDFDHKMRAAWDDAFDSLPMDQNANARQHNKWRGWCSQYITTNGELNRAMEHALLYGGGYANKHFEDLLTVGTGIGDFCITNRTFATALAHNRTTVVEYLVVHCPPATTQSVFQNFVQSDKPHYTNVVANFLNTQILDDNLEILQILTPHFPHFGEILADGLRVAAINQAECFELLWAHAPHESKTLAEHTTRSEHEKYLTSPAIKRAAEMLSACLADDLRAAIAAQVDCSNTGQRRKI